MGRIKDRIRNWQGIQGYSSWWSMSARVRKHYCPRCYGLLEVIRKSQIVNSESEEAKYFNFPCFEGARAIGNVKFTWDVYYCERCSAEILIGDMRAYERELKRLGIR